MGAILLSGSLSSGGWQCACAFNKCHEQLSNVHSAGRDGGETELIDVEQAGSPPDLKAGENLDRTL